MRWIREAIGLKRIPLNTKELFGMVPRKPKAEPGTVINPAPEPAVTSAADDSKGEATKNNPYVGLTKQFNLVPYQMKHIEKLNDARLETYYRLRYEHGCKNKEIAQRLKVTESNVTQTFKKINDKIS